MSEQPKAERAAQAAVVARLAKGVGNCELTALSGSGRCREDAVAARWDGMFIDLVCETHAERARERGVTVLDSRIPPADPACRECGSTPETCARSGVKCCPDCSHFPPASTTEDDHG